MIYVLSDIHGDMDAFDSILSQIQLGEDDHLYIIGDVIDRGPHSIELLQRIRKMRNTTMLLGNHEYMMTDRLRHPEDRELAALWYRNGGGETETSFEKLSADEQEDLLQYLEGLPVQTEISVNGESFLLVHARPLEDYKDLRGWYKSEVQMAVWSRIESWTKLPEGKTIVFGHTPTSHFQLVKGKMRIFHGDRRIGIDCGCAYPWRHGQLGCLRLDDMKEFYSSGGCGVPVNWDEWEETD